MKNYVWREGDTPKGLAARLGLAPEALAAANPGVDFEALRPGGAIALPAPAACPYAGFCAVARGQSILSIARISGVSPMSLMNANPYIDPSELTEGEVLAIPEREYCFSRYGDRLITLCERWGVPLWRLAALNPRAGTGVLPPGARLRLR